MIRLAVLLLGAAALRPIWAVLLAAGMVWVALGAGRPWPKAGVLSACGANLSMDR